MKILSIAIILYGRYKNNTFFLQPSLTLKVLMDYFTGRCIILWEKGGKKIEYDMIQTFEMRRSCRKPLSDFLYQFLWIFIEVLIFVLEFYFIAVLHGKMRCMHIEFNIGLIVSYRRVVIKLLHIFKLLLLLLFS